MRQKRDPKEVQAEAAKLKGIFDQRKKGEGFTQEEFGDMFDIGNQAMVNQYLNGKRPLNASVAKKFAIGLGIKIEDFSPFIAAFISKASQYVKETSKDVSPVVITAPDSINGNVLKKLITILSKVDKEGEQNILTYAEGVALNSPRKKASQKADLLNFPQGTK